MAAVFAAGAVTVLFQLSLLVTKRTTTSFAVACSLAFSYYFWASAVVAEVYTLHVFLTGLTIHLLVKWDKSQGNRLLFAALFAWGLSFGNHMSTMLMGPAVAFLILRGLQQNRVSAATVLLAVPAFVLPLTLYLPWKYSAVALPYVISHYDSFGQLARVDHTTIGGMWETLTAQQFESLIFAYRWGSNREEAGGIALERRRDGLSPPLLLLGVQLKAPTFDSVILRSAVGRRRICQSSHQQNIRFARGDNTVFPFTMPYWRLH